MPIRLRHALLAGCVAVLAPPLASVGNAAAGATGTYTLDPSAKLDIVDAVAFHRASWEGDGIVVLLATAPLDHARWAATLDPAGFAEEYEGEVSWVELEYRPDGTWTGTRYGLRYDGGSSSGSSYDDAAAAGLAATIGGGKVSGRLRFALDDGSAADLTLAAPLLEPTGDPLPEGGGDVAAAIRDCNAAYAKKDLAGVERSCEEDTGAIIESAVRMRSEGYEWEDPWTPQGASECDVAAIGSPAIGAGVVRGDQARVEVSGGWKESERCGGTVHLRRESGRWRVSRSALRLVSEPSQ